MENYAAGADGDGRVAAVDFYGRPNAVGGNDLNEDQLEQYVKPQKVEESPKLRINNFQR